MTEYFSHDYDSREDEKIQNLIFNLGMEGYGIYWSIIEMLYKNDGYMQTQCERIAFALHTDTETTNRVINDFNLFETHENIFHSNSVLNRLKLRNGKSFVAKKAAKARWDKARNDDADAMPTQCECNADAMPTQCDSNAIKESKVNNNNNKEYISFIFLFNEITGKKFRGTEKSKKQFGARIKENFTMEDFKIAITSCKNDPYHQEHPQYLTPEFITRSDKLQRYLNTKPSIKPRLSNI